MTKLKDLSPGDRFIFEGGSRQCAVRGVEGDILSFVFRELLGSLTEGSVNVNTGEGVEMIPDYMLWHIDFVTEPLTRKQYTEEEKQIARARQYPLFVELIGEG